MCHLKLAQATNEVQNESIFRVTIYVDPMSAWYDYKTKEEIVNSRMAHQLKVVIVNAIRCQ